MLLFLFNTNKDLSKEERGEMWGTMVSSKGTLYLMAFQFICDTYGKAYLSFVFCADTTQYMVGYVACAEKDEREENEVVDIGVLSLRGLGVKKVKADSGDEEL